MRKYELVCIFDPQAGENSFDGLVEKYEGYLNSHGAEVINIDRWGMRQLAYSTPSMRKRRQGYYVLYQFQGEPTMIAPLEEELRIDEHVLRHLVIVVEGEFLRVPELVPENQIIFGPPPRERGDRGRGRDRDNRRRDRDSGPPAGRSESRESTAAGTEAASSGAEEAAPAPAPVSEEKGAESPTGADD